MAANAAVDFAKAVLSSVNMQLVGAISSLVCCLQFWTALYWVTTVDLLVRHVGMTIKVGLCAMLL